MIETMETDGYPNTKESKGYFSKCQLLLIFQKGFLSLKPFLWDHPHPLVSIYANGIQVNKSVSRKLVNQSLVIHYSFVFIIHHILYTSPVIASKDNLGAFDSFQSPCILRTFGCRFTSTQSSLQILMEYLPKGSLRNYISVCCTVPSPSLMHSSVA